MTENGLGLVKMFADPVDFGIIRVMKNGSRRLGRGARDAFVNSQRRVRDEAGYGCIQGQYKRYQGKSRAPGLGTQLNLPLPGLAIRPNPAFPIPVTKPTGPP